MNAVSKGKLFIGTSNIVIPGNKSTFPEAFQNKSRLHYYSTLFNTVELNATFYKVPQSATFEKWANEVSADFRFSIKVWKEITHAKDLKFRETDVESFLKKASFIGNKKGCMLLQLPGRISFDYFNQVEKMLDVISQSEYTSGWKIAVEFRNNDWYVGETFELLAEHNATIVQHDFPKGRNDVPLKKTKNIYLRFHGESGDYRGSYSDVFLKQTKQRIQQWLKKGVDVYAYFNNTLGDAFNNATTLKSLTD